MTRTPRTLLAAPLLLALACSGAEPRPDAPPASAAPATSTAGETAQVPAPASADSKRTPPARPTRRQAPWDRSGIDDWTTPPKPGPEPTFHPLKPDTFTLRSGLKVVIAPRPGVGLVAMEVVVRGAGAAADPAGAPGLAAYVADLVDEGAGKRSALEIAAEVERLGASLETTASADHATLSMETLASTFDASFDLLVSVLTRPTFDPKEARRVRDERIDRLRTRRDRSREVASLIFGQALYGPKTPYGHPVDGFARCLRRFDARKARAFYEKHWRPEAMVLVIAGDVDPVALKKKIRSRLRRFRPRGRRLKIRAPKVRPVKGGPRLTLVDRPGAPQSEVRVGLVGIARDDPRWVAFEVVTTLLGGTFTSRLNHRLREELGYTYGVRALEVPRQAPGPFLIATALHTPKTADAAREILKMVGALASEDVPAGELQKVKQNLVRALPERFETSADTAHTFAELAAAGLPLTWYEGYADAVRAVDAAQVRALAAKLIPAAELRFAVVGDAGVIEKGLTEILGEARRLDPEGRPLR